MNITKDLAFGNVSRGSRGTVNNMNMCSLLIMNLAMPDIMHNMRMHNDLNSITIDFF